ncbi:hypothetical protein CsatA_020975 [Cannabis sativa]
MKILAVYSGLCSINEIFFSYSFQYNFCWSLHTYIISMFLSIYIFIFSNRYFQWN